MRTQFLQDALDILLPAGTLGYHHLDDGILGIVGLVPPPPVTHTSETASLTASFSQNGHLNHWPAGADRKGPQVKQMRGVFVGRRWVWLEVRLCVHCFVVPSKT